MSKNYNKRTPASLSACANEFFWKKPRFEQIKKIREAGKRAKQQSNVDCEIYNETILQILHKCS